jgi:membrane-associated PAP2 superfamily phosphatase
LRLWAALCSAARCPALARGWLAAAVAAGLVLGLAQQWRGAHFMSHTLWSGWVCWCVAWALDAAARPDAGLRGMKAARP